MGKNFGKLVRVLCVEHDTSPAQLAKKLGMTRQNLNRRLNRDSLRLSEAVDILNMLGYKVYAEKDGEKLDIY